MSDSERQVPSAETIFISRLRRVLGKDLTRSDIDFLLVLARDVVAPLFIDYIHEKSNQQY